MRNSDSIAARPNEDASRIFNHSREIFKFHPQLQSLSKFLGYEMAETVKKDPEDVIPIKVEFTYVCLSCWTARV